MDSVVRAMGQEMAKGLGQPVLVENKPGAGTVLGVDYVAKSPPDGYTLVGVGNSFTVNHTLVASLPYDSLRDLRAISLLTKTPNVIAGHPSVPANDLGQLVADRLHDAPAVLEGGRSRELEAQADALQGPLVAQHLVEARAAAHVRKQDCVAGGLGFHIGGYYRGRATWLSVYCTWCSTRC